MDKEDKKAELSIRNNFKKWLNIEGLDSAVYVLGNKIIGKTVTCHLIKRVADGFNDPKLEFKQKKKQYEFEYEGQINAKATKPLTIFPKLYKIEKNNINIIEVPPKFYDIEKKRPNLDRLITLVGISYTSKKAKFLIFVESSKTSGKLQPWKKSFATVFDSFSPIFFNENALNSIGFVFTKAKQLNQVYLSRISDLMKNITIEDAHKESYLNLLNLIMEKKRSEIWTKFGNESSEKTAQSDANRIINLYENLSQADMFTIHDGQADHMLKIGPVQLLKDEKELYNNFVGPLNQIIQFLAQLFQKIFTSKTDPDLKDLLIFLEQKRGRLNQIIDAISIDSDKDEQESLTLNNKYRQLVQISSKTNIFQSAIGIGKSLFFIEFKQEILSGDKLNNQSLKRMLQLLAKHGFFIKEIAIILKPLYIQLILFSLFQERIGPYILNFDFKEFLRSREMIRLFTQENQSQLKDTLLNSEFTATTPDKKKFIENLLDRLFSDSSSDSMAIEKVEAIKKKLAAFQIDTSCPEKGIPKIYEQINNLINVEGKIEKISTLKSEDQLKDIAFLNNMLPPLAIMLAKIGHEDLSIQIFKDSGDYNKAKQCFEKKLGQLLNHQQRESLQSNQSLILGYIDLLIEMRLLESALNCCYHYASIYKELRPKLFERMKLVRQKYSEPFSQDFEERFITGNSKKLFSFFEDRQILKKVGRVVAQLQKSQS